ncbi:MAG: hypothetical protein J0I98_11440 [Mesorhizobium sp.]|nr:hypothetical protein [Mesorhizobium sp.]MBN9243397.1 hypothetical protein [Mesorhizobium sp.]
MLGAIILAIAVSAALILFGFGLMVLAAFADAMTPIPGQAKVTGVAVVGTVLLALGLALLALTLWPDPPDAAIAPVVSPVALV